MGKEKKQIREERSYNNMQTYRSSALDKEFYSYQRLDLIIISLSTGGIITLLTIFKEHKESFNLCAKMFLVISLTLFVVSIITNIFSQISSAKANKENADWALTEMEIINKLRSEDEEYVINKSHGKNTRLLNNVSLYTLISALVISAISAMIFIF